MAELRMLEGHPAALLSYEGERMLLVSDLHIGFEERFSQSGVRIEASVERMEKELEQILDEMKPHRLIILGDLKYTVNRLSISEWRSVPPFLERLCSRIAVIHIPGNHDGGIEPLLPRRVKQSKPEGLMVGDTALMHGHTRPGRALSRAKRIVMGHVHPVFNMKGSSLSGSQVWVSLRAPKRMALDDHEGDDDLEVLVLPSFNRELATAGYSAFRDSTISPILRQIGPHIKESLIVTLEGGVIGEASSLQCVL